MRRVDKSEITSLEREKGSGAVVHKTAPDPFPNQRLEIEIYGRMVPDAQSR